MKNYIEICTSVRNTIMYLLACVFLLWKSDEAECKIKWYDLDLYTMNCVSFYIVKVTFINI